ncbi:MAG: ATP-grasp domain-containing protein, partial [Pseudonocardiaceae bacterium]
LKALPDLRGLINSTDTWLRPGAELAAQFELPGPDPAAVRTLRDTRGVRVLLHEQGLSRGTAVAVPSGHTAAAVVREMI